MAYFLKGFPPQLGIFSKASFVCSPSGEDVATIIASAKGCPGAEFFVGASNLACFGASIEAESLKEALSLTRHAADSLLDGLSVALSRPLPKLGCLVIAIDSAEPQGQWVHFSPIAWVELSSRDPQRDVGPSDRTKVYLDSMIPYLDVISKDHTHHDTPLARQLAQALRMYRHGATADTFAVEYLCKFSALESLVCAEERMKGRLLTTRLPVLFRKDKRVTEQRVKKIWNDRSSAIHESSGFYSKHAPGTRAVQVHLNEVDHLFRGVVAFATAQLEVARTIPALWKGVMSFELPGWALERSTDPIRLAVHETVSQTNVFLPWAKRWFAAYLEHSHRQRQS